MFNRLHILVCHGCGKFHTLRSQFLSSPMAMRFAVRGTNVAWYVPMWGCAECQGTGKIARAYYHGMTPEATSLAQKLFHFHWRVRLEEESVRWQRGW